MPLLPQVPAPKLTCLMWGETELLIAKLKFGRRSVLQYDKFDPKLEGATLKEYIYEHKPHVDLTLIHATLSKSLYYMLGRWLKPRADRTIRANVTSNVTQVSWRLTWHTWRLTWHRCRVASWICSLNKSARVKHRYCTGIWNGDIARAVLIAPEVTEHYGNDAIGTRIGSPSGTSSFLLVATEATLEKSLFKTGSEIVAHAYEAAKNFHVKIFVLENFRKSWPITKIF